MADVTLLVNSTDTALLNGSAVSPVATNDVAGNVPAGGGFASVLGNQLTPRGSMVEAESPPQMPPSAESAVIETGDAQPFAGKPLPSTALPDVSQQPDNNPAALPAALLSSMIQDMPAAKGQGGTTLAAGTLASPLESALLPRDGAARSMPSTLAMAHSGSNGGKPVDNTAVPSSLLNPTVNSPATVLASPSAPHSTLPPLSNATEDAQRATSLSAVTSMLGKPISTAAQQALSRASLYAGKSHALRVESMSPDGSAALQTQHNLSNASGANNSVGVMMRMHMFNAAMGAATKGDASTDLHLPTSSATTVAPAPLMAVGALTEDVSGLSAGLSRLPGVSASGFAPTLPLSTPVGQSAWANELGQRVAWLANSELREAQLQLHPRSLGAVEVRIAYGHEQQLNISFSAANPVAREALDASLPRLREMLEQQGLQLADANISHESFAEQEQRKHVKDTSTMQDESHLLDEPVSDAIVGNALAGQWVGEGMLDAYA